MYLYAIKDLNTDLFVTNKSLSYRLEPLGFSTTFFKSRSDAEKCMIEKHMDKSFNPITKELAWDEIENLYRLDRWNINMSQEEFEGWESRYDLKIVKLYIGEIEYEGGVHSEPEEDD